MQKYGIPAAERNSCMQFIGVLLSAILGGQTNNYLERYNRHLNEHFVNAHPNLFDFIAGIQKDEFDYTMRARNIRIGSTLLRFDGDSFEKPTIPNA
ncbi:hypothetical protein HZS_3560 [Henneguya salminicola]|nr:hypothetical protein HZS_3560 [Henneguya salminicola]